ncbi:MAG: LPP20 family lipoprotein [Treponema sp.]|jgi:hypothetical protein|nr:LPP20 family lipoprotein [Treponema sp.]
MKKYFVLFMVSILSVLMGACLSWVNNPPVQEDVLYGIGSAKMGSESTSWKAAENRARESVAFQIHAAINALQVDYNREVGTGNRIAASSLFESVNRQATSTAMSGARIVKRGKRGGTYYVMVSYQIANIKNSINGAATQSGVGLTQVEIDALVQNALQKLSEQTPQVN